MSLRKFIKCKKCALIMPEARKLSHHIYETYFNRDRLRVEDLNIRGCNVTKSAVIRVVLLISNHPGDLRLFRASDKPSPKWVSANEYSSSVTGTTSTWLRFTTFTDPANGVGVHGCITTSISLPCSPITNMGSSDPSSWCQNVTGLGNRNRQRVLPINIADSDCTKWAMSLIKRDQLTNG